MRSEAAAEHHKEYMRVYRQRTKKRDAGKEAERHRIYRHDNPEKVKAYAEGPRVADPERYYRHNLKSYLKRKPLPKSEARAECHRRASRRREIRRSKDPAALEARVAARAQAIVPVDLAPFTRASVIALIVSRIFSGHLPMRLTKSHADAAIEEVLGTQEQANV